MKPTQLRMHPKYIIYYNTWVWVLATGRISLTFYLHLSIFLGLIPFTILFFSILKIKSSLTHRKKRVQIITENTGEHHCQTFCVHRLAGEEEGIILSKQSEDVNLSVITVTFIFIFMFCHAPRLAACSWHLMTWPLSSGW